jgi:hypothetical protein
MKEKYLVSGFTRDKEAIYANGIRIFAPAEYDRLRRRSRKREMKPFLSYPRLLE